MPQGPVLARWDDAKRRALVTAPAATPVEGDPELTAAYVARQQAKAPLAWLKGPFEGVTDAALGAMGLGPDTRANRGGAFLGTGLPLLGVARRTKAAGRVLTGEVVAPHSDIAAVSVPELQTRAKRLWAIREWTPAQTQELQEIEGELARRGPRAIDPDVNLGMITPEADLSGFTMYELQVIGEAAERAGRQDILRQVIRAQRQRSARDLAESGFSTTRRGLGPGQGER